LAGLVAWAVLRFSEDTAARTIAETGAIAIGAISAIFAAAMGAVATLSWFGGRRTDDDDPPKQ
jgi:hypothetical protein